MFLTLRNTTPKENAGGTREARTVPPHHDLLSAVRRRAYSPAVTDLLLHGDTSRPEGEEGKLAELAALLREHFATPVPRYLYGSADEALNRLVHHARILRHAGQRREGHQPVPDVRPADGTGGILSGRSGILWRLRQNRTSLVRELVRHLLYLYK
jgi:hypothetical protein